MDKKSIINVDLENKRSVFKLGRAFVTGRNVDIRGLEQQFIKYESLNDKEKLEFLNMIEYWCKNGTSFNLDDAESERYQMYVLCNNKGLNEKQKFELRDYIAQYRNYGFVVYCPNEDINNNIKATTTEEKYRQMRSKVIHLSAARTVVLYDDCESVDAVFSLGVLSHLFKIDEKKDLVLHGKGEIKDDFVDFVVRRLKSGRLVGDGLN